MRLALCLYRYFPHSGLARDMLRIAAEAARRGHHVDVYAREWHGDIPPGMRVRTIGVRGWTNHGRNAAFVNALRARLQREAHDAVVGFNKMPGLDFYYAADGCYAARVRRRRPRAYELTPRCRALKHAEEAVFGPRSRTRVLLLSETARLEYRAFYAISDSRLRLLPPTLDAAHRRGPLQADRRRAVRADLGAAGGDLLILTVGSGYHTKGMDRSIRGLAALPDTLRRRARLVVVGTGKPRSFRRLAARLGVDGRVVFTGGRDDVPELLRAADVLVHPARQENTGNVLLEALAAGLPVIATANCGYARHVEAAQAGNVLPLPYSQQSLDRALAGMLQGGERERFAANGRAYGNDEALCRMPEAAVDLIEGWHAGADDGPPSFEGCIDPPLSDLAARLPRVEDWLAMQGTEYRRTRERRTVRFDHAGKAYFLKAHYGVGWGEVAKNLVQLKLPVLDAGREWSAVHLVQSLGLASVDALACGFQGSGPSRRSFMVTRELDDAVSLETLVAGGRLGPGQRRRLIERVGRAARALHGGGIQHRDFYLCHFLLRPASADTDEATLHLIDLHRAGLHRRLSGRRRVKDIGGLYYSALGARLTRAERCRFIRAYAGGASLRTALAKRAFWRRVERRAHALERAEKRRGRADTAGTAADPR